MSNPKVWIATDAVGNRKSFENEFKSTIVSQMMSYGLVQIEPAEV